MAGPRYWIDKQPSDDGYLALEGDPGPWIEANSASCSSVRQLELKLNFQDEIRDSIRELTELTRLDIYQCGEFLCTPNPITTLLKFKYFRVTVTDCTLEKLLRNLCQLVSLTHLCLYDWDNITALPEILGQLKSLTDLRMSKCNNLTELPKTLGHLESLRYLTLDQCHKLTTLPETLGQLKSLTGLSLSGCDGLTALPETLGQLKSLIGLSLSGCICLTALPETLGHLENLSHMTLDGSFIKSLPDSMKNLYNLEYMAITYCFPIKELPVDLKVLHFKLEGSSIKFLPKGFTCQHLELYNSADVLLVPTELVSIQRLTIFDVSNSDYSAPLNLNFNPSILSIKNKGCSFISRVLESSDGLSGLMVLDIKDNIIECLPWSITKLRKLRTLILPTQFRLESLPYHLNDSVTITVDHEHVRKTWKELKMEIEPRFSPVSGEVMAIEDAQSSYDAEFLPNYLLLNGDTMPWIDYDCKSFKHIRFLDLRGLRIPDYSEREILGNFIEELKELTHLYVDDFECNDFQLPETSTRLRHLSLEYCYGHFPSNSLDKLTNLETLDINLHRQKLHTDMDLPVSLKRLSLQNAIVMSLPASMEKLTNLKALDLSWCVLEGLNPLGNLYHTKLKLSCCSCSTSLSLPTCLRHLELLRPDLNELRLDEYFNQLFCLETLSIKCYWIEYFPSIAVPCYLEELRLQDCFKLEKLPPNLEDMVELRILDISGTRIKSLPHSILNLHKLQQLILSNWFTPNSLPMSLKKVSVIDDTPEAYYQIMSEDYPIATNESYDIVGVVEAGIQGSELQVNAEQGTPHDGNSHHAQRDIASVGEASFEEPEKELAAEHGLLHSTNNHHPSENRQNLYPQSDNPSICEAGFEEPQMEFIAEQDIAHTANNHHASENGQDKNPQSDSKRKTRREDISKEMIESCWERNMMLKEAAAEFGVSESTLKRRMKELGYSGWERVGAKKRKHHNDSVMETQSHMDSDLEWLRVGAKKRKQHNEQPSGNASDQNLVNDQHRMPNHESYNYDAVNNSRRNSTMGTVVDSMTETQSHMDGHQHAQQQLGSANEYTLSNVMQQNGTSSTFVVKACYKGPAVRFEFCLTYGIAKLYEEVGKRLELDVASFKINYLDEDDDLIYMARNSSVSDLEHAWRLSEVSEKSGMKVVRLLVVAET